MGLYACQSRVIVINKASQMGASEWAISDVLHEADENDANGLYLFPTDAHISDFSSARFGPAIESSPYLSGIVIDGSGTRSDGERKRGADRVTLKRVRNRFIYLRGSVVKPNGQAPQLKSIDADVLVLDEVDEMDARAPAIAVKRLGHSALAHERWISTPTYAGFGIHAKWGETDQREWHVRCEGCGERQPLTLRQMVTEFDALGRPHAWHQQGGKPFIACRRCGKPLDRLARGEWVATYSDREIAGFHMSKLFSPLADLGEIIKALNTTDETKRREAFNQDLGETYTPKGGQITDDILESCRRDDLVYQPFLEEDTFAGIDVGRVLHMVIRGPRHPETGERPLRFAGEVDSFDAARNLLSAYRARRVVIDALPETRMARKLQAEYRYGSVFLAYYVGQAAGSKDADPYNWDYAKGVVNMDRTRTLDATYARFFSGENTLHASIRSVPDYYNHLKALVRVIETTKTGDKVAVYVQSGPDHYAHAENYCTAASSDSSAAIMDFYRRRTSLAPTSDVDDGKEE